MRILLTNDDGYDALGLLALWQAVRSLGQVDIDVVAPSAAQSGVGHTVSQQIHYRHIEFDELGKIVVVDGTPADCVRAALVIPGFSRPDWVISGINRGGNLGVDVYYSGTVAAAREATILGIPSIAISQFVKPDIPDDWARSARESAAVIAALIRSDGSLSPGADADIHKQLMQELQDHQRSKNDADRCRCWNVNLPKMQPNQLVRATRIVPLSNDPLPNDYEHSINENGSETLLYTGSYPKRPVTPGTDVDTVFQGMISISPIFP